MTAAPDPLGPTVGCPRGSRCAACGGGQGLELATYQTPAGVFCATVCWPCVAVGNRRRCAPGARRPGGSLPHCQHLGINPDQMAALLQAEREEESE